MLRRNYALASILFALVVLASADASAIAQRTFVASHGVAANTAFNCSIAKPCRAFSEAMSVTSANGEVIVLDSAGYGPVAITQSVSIIAPAGVYAGITVFSGDGITINTPGVTVLLHGLTITGQGGAVGINVSQPSAVQIENCVISGMASVGLFYGGGGALRVKDSIIRDNGGDGIQNFGYALFERVVIVRNNGSGFAHGFGGASIVDSTIQQNNANGILVDGTTNPFAYLVVERTSVHGNVGDGIQVKGANARLTLARDVIEGNGLVGVHATLQAHAMLTDVVISRNGANSASAGIETADAGTIVTLESVKVTEHGGNGVVIGAGTAVQSLQNNAIVNNLPANVSGGVFTPVSLQ